MIPLTEVNTAASQLAAAVTKRGDLENRIRREGLTSDLVQQRAKLTQEMAHWEDLLREDNKAP